MAGELQLALLGGFHADCDGVPLAGRLARKAQALLAYLAVTGRPQAREALAGLLWGESPESAARASLRQAVGQLRAVLGEHLQADRVMIALNPASPYWLDVAVFRDRVTAALAAPTPNLAELRHAVALYTGDFLASFTLRDAPTFDEWVIGEQERLRQLALLALQRLADGDAARADYPAAIEALTRLLTIEPWRESAHRRLMQLFADSGQRAAALAQYERCRRLLAETLGVEPDPATLRLYEQLRPTTANSPPSPFAAAALPLPSTSLLGREADLMRLAAHLADPACRLLTLIGPAGVGKTRLALEVAARQAAGYDDGVRFVALAPVSDAGLVASTIATALGRRDRRGRPSRARLADALRSLNLLLVLDNFEHVVDAAPLVADLLAVAPRLVVLVTSRTPLHLRGEQVYPVAPLAVPDLAQRPDAAALAMSPAVALFARRAAAVQPDFGLSPATAEAVAAICARLDGLPLAIELAAARITTLPPAALLARLGSRLALLTSGPRDLPARQQTLRAAIAWSHDLLEPAVRPIFRRLSIFAGGCTLAATTAVAFDSSGLDEQAVLDSLAWLIDQSLLRQVGPSDEEPRFTMLETIREYALECLEASGEAEAVRQRHATYFATLAERAGMALDGADQVAWLTQLDTEIDNLRLALAWYRDHDPAAGLDLVASLSRYWQVRSLLAEGQHWIEAMRPSHVSAAWVEALLAAGVLARQQAQFASARAFLAEAGDLSRTLGSSRLTARALCELGSVAYWLGDYQQAEDLLTQALDLGREIGDQRSLRATLGWLSAVLRDRGDSERAWALAEEALVIQRALDDRWGLCTSLWALGQMALRLGHLARAKMLCDEGLALARTIGTPLDTALLQWTLGMVAYHAGDGRQARALVEASLAVLEQRGLWVRIPMVQRDLGLVWWATGDAAGALVHLRESLARCWEDGQRGQIAGGLEALATVLTASEPERAAWLLGAATALREVGGYVAPPVDSPGHRATFTAVREALGEAVYAAALAAGAAMPLEDMVAEALVSGRTSSETPLHAG